jgi:hypothetical protein
MDELKEYTTFHVTTKDGADVEMAVVDEFEYHNKNYVVGALIEGDTVKDEELYIYKAKVTEDDFTVEKINNQIEYQKIAKAYMEMGE